MRETVRSLRAYFIFVGVVLLLQSFVLAQKRLTWYGDVLVLNWTLTALAFLYLGAALRTLLQSRPRVVTTILAAVSLLLVGVALLSLAAGAGSNVFVEIGVGLLLTRYLLRNVRRLAAELAPPR
jgi:hypothetical protein